MRESASVRKIALFGKFVLKSARTKIKSPIIPVAKAVFCVVEIAPASGFARDILWFIL
jgi:hypothetical protein